MKVGDALLETIFDPGADSAGLVIDGFPRTAFQVELLKLLYDKMMSLHVQNADSPDEWRFPRPSFKVQPCHAVVADDISLLPRHLTHSLASFCAQQCSSADLKAYISLLFSRPAWWVHFSSKSRLCISVCSKL